MGERSLSGFERMWRTRTDRRAFLLGGLALVGAGAFTRVQARPRWADTPFALGVASGDPTADGVVIWTRLAPRAAGRRRHAAGAVEVGWEVGRRRLYAKIVTSGSATATADWGHSVHVEVRGPRPGSRGTCIASTPATRRARSAAPARCPAADATPETAAVRVRLVPALRGRAFTAYEHMAAEDLDLVFHLGDYIYEEARPRQAGRASTPAPRLIDRSTTTATATRSTRPTRTCRRCTPRARGSSPGTTTRSTTTTPARFPRAAGRVDRAQFLGPPRRRLPGLLRAHAVCGAIASRAARHAALPPVQLRQAGGVLRARHAAVPHRSAVRRRQQAAVRRPCPIRRRRCSAAQERWLYDALGRSAGRWNVLPQQVMMARVDREPGDGERYSMDQWPGYEPSRRGCSSSSTSANRRIPSC